MNDKKEHEEKHEEESDQVEHVIGMCSPDHPDYARQQRILREAKKNNPRLYQKFLNGD